MQNVEVSSHPADRGGVRQEQTLISEKGADDGLARGLDFRVPCLCRSTLSCFEQ